MISSLLLTVLFFLNVSSEKCRTNNDCDSGRCEWRRCVGKLGKVISGRVEITNCYIDEDCPTRYVCRDGTCKERLPLITDIHGLRPDHCYTDANCPAGFKCGFYKKCYNMSDSRYIVESLMHIPCQNEAPGFCAEVTGFDNAMCREIYFEYENVRSYICQLPPPFTSSEMKACGAGDACSRYSTCIRGTCYQPFWVTVRERCKSNDECTFRAYCNSDGGCQEGKWVLTHRSCRVSADCNDRTDIVKFICSKFECSYRRNVPFECDACRFDEFCDLYENCLQVQRLGEFNCDGDNWFYWYSAFYCSTKVEKTYVDALTHCSELDATLAYPPDRGTEKSFSAESALLSYLALRAGWVVEGNDETEITFVNWKNEEEREKKSRFFCKKEVHRSSMPNNATAYRGQKCQTSFVYRHDNCYIAGFTNFMPRFAIRTICNLLDAEIIKIRNMEEAQTAYGLAGGKSFWLGLKKGKRNWYWDSSTYGSRAYFFFWRAGQPDITSDKNCVYSSHAGEWMSADCDNFRSPKIFICQGPSYKY
uniref:C-type lectin domain-containing protein n=1 Tax=Onchocerca volvulus TaxID=6282 RepID=A0A8R1XSB4_ONCVO